MEKSIESLKLSTRAYNLLKRLRINTIEELLDTPDDWLYTQRGCGVKTINEIIDLKKQLNNGEGCIEEVEKVPDYLIQELSRYSVDELELSCRPDNILKRLGIFHMDELFKLSDEEIFNLRGMGQKSFDEIKNKKKAWFDNTKQNLMLLKELEYNTSLVEKEYFMKMERLLQPLINVEWKKIKIWSDNCNIKEQAILDNKSCEYNENIVFILKIPQISVLLEDFFTEATYEKEIMRLDQFEEVLKSKSLEFDYRIIIQHLIKNDICEVNRGEIYRKRVRLTEYVYKNFSDLSVRDNDILNKRLSGMSLQEIAVICGVTRERIRQILRKTIVRIPNLYEDYYKEVYSYFKWSKNDFCKAFPECGIKGYEYLFTKYENGKEEISLDTIPNYSGPFQDKLHEIYMTEYKKQEMKSLTKPRLIRRILLANSEKSMSFDEFVEKYYLYLEKMNLSKNKFDLNINTVSNYLRYANHIVFDESNKIRYCNADVKVLWKEIDFKRYKNLVISAERIYKDYKELMDELDIRDGYELYYVIKYSDYMWKNKDFTIYFRRLPNIVFGEADEKKQALNLLKSLSPIKSSDFFEAYEEYYGVKKETAAANTDIYKTIAPYLVNGTYMMDVPIIDSRDVDLFKSELIKKPMWFIDEIEQKFNECCRYSSKNTFNAATFRKLGYTLHSGYIYDSKYGTITNFWSEEIFNKKIIDLSDLDGRLSNLSMFSSLLDKKKKALDYIETAPKILMSSEEVYNKYHLSKSDIRLLQKELSPYYEIQYFNGYSIWNDIKDLPLVQRLKGNKWMCTCIMRQQEGICSQTVSGGIVLSKNYSELTLEKICNWIVEKEGTMSVKQLTERLNSIFGAELNKYKVAQKLRNIDEWEKVVTDSYDEYINSIINEDFEESLEEDFFKEEFF